MRGAQGLVALRCGGLGGVGVVGEAPAESAVDDAGRFRLAEAGEFGPADEECADGGEAGLVADEDGDGGGGEGGERGDDVAWVLVGGERGDGLDGEIALQADGEELGGLDRADEGAGPEVGGFAVVPAQAVAEGASLAAAVGGEVAVPVAQDEGLLDGFGVPDEEHLHGAKVSQAGRYRSGRSRSSVRAMKLYGSTTSPFVRRVRVVAAEVGEPIEWIDTAVEAGQAALREISPIRKVPVAVLDGQTVFDSRAIMEWLTSARGYGGLAAPRARWRERNVMNAIDAALESMIMLFSMKRDGVAVDDTPFAKRQFDRVEAIFAWLGGELSAHQFGVPELSAICALDWMDFRKTYPTEHAAALVPVREAWRDRPSLAATRPHT